MKAQEHATTPLSCLLDAVLTRECTQDLLEKSWKLRETMRVLREEYQVLLEENQRLPKKLSEAPILVPAPVVIRPTYDSVLVENDVNNKMTHL